MDNNCNLDHDRWDASKLNSTGISKEIRKAPSKHIFIELNIALENIWAENETKSN